MNPLKAEVVQQLQKQTGLSPEEVEKLLESPPREEMGDYAFPCFVLSKKLRKAPPAFSQYLAKK